MPFTDPGLHHVVMGRDLKPVGLIGLLVVSCLALAVGSLVLVSLLFPDSRFWIMGFAVTLTLLALAAVTIVAATVGAAAALGAVMKRSG